MLPLPSSGSATGNPRNKVQLMPGHSLVDWIRLGKSGQDLTGVCGKILDVTTEELAKHNKVDDAWTAIRGKVYNITAYMEFHPGGVSELMRGAGIDCTVLFDEVHKWVNYESMLNKCLVGKLVTTSSATTTPTPRRGPKGSLLGSVGALQPPSPLKPPANGISSSTTNAGEKPVENISVPVVVSNGSQPRYDWFQSETAVTLNVYTRSAAVHRENVIVELTERKLRVCVFVDDHTFHINKELEADVRPEIKVSVGKTNGRVEISLPKLDSSKHWTSLCQSTSNDECTWRKTANEEMTYWSCRVSSVDYVTHDTNLYCIDFPDGVFMSIPVGRHVHITACVSDVDVVHAYTIIPPSLLGDHPTAEQKVRDGRALCLMVKIYRDGVLTPFIGQLRPDDCARISKSYAGDFSVSRLTSVDRIVMYAAGTGFTPMAAMLAHVYAESKQLERRREVLLMFFNKTEKDILWQDELDRLSQSAEWFTVHHVLSEPDSSWSGLKGFLNAELFTPYISRRDDAAASAPGTTLLCACGPRPFADEFRRLAKMLNFTDDMIHMFAG